MRARAWCWAVAAGALLAGCRDPGSSGPAATEAGAGGDSGIAGVEAEAELEILYAGCASTLRGPICVLDEDRRLRLWLADPALADRLELDGGVRAARAAIESSTEVDGGRRLGLIVPEGTEAIALGAGENDAARRLWTLRVRPPEDLEVDTLPARLPPASDPAAAVRELFERVLPAVPPAARGLALKRLAFSFAPATAADAEAKRALLRRAVAEHRARGRLSDEIDATTLLAQSQLYDSRHLAAAHETLGALPPASAAWPGESRYLAAFYRGLMAREQGDLRASLHWLEEAARLAGRLGLTRQRDAAEQVLGWQLRLAGSHARAEALYARLERERLDALEGCAEVALLNNIGWNRLLALEAGQPAGDPLPSLERALASLERAPCPFPADPRHVLINLALAYLHRGELPRAEAHLARARAVEEPAPLLEQLVWLEDVAGRLALAAGRPARALERFERLDRLAAEALSPDARWRAAAGRARALAALDRRDQALASYAAAERMLDAESRRVPIHAGRAMFAAAREPATRRYLDLLLDAGRLDEALTVVRRARVRAFRALHRGDWLAALDGERRDELDRRLAAYLTLRDELDRAASGDWQLPADRQRQDVERRADLRRRLVTRLDRVFALLGPDAPAADHELAPPAPGELLLAVHPLEEGWVAFASDGGGTRAERLGDLGADTPPETLGERLLTPFAAPIAAARRLRLLPYGFWRAVDLHALPFAGDVLLAAAPVSYGFDLPPVSGRDDAEATGRALVVADPGGDLPAARREAEAVAALLAGDARGWRVEVLAERRARGRAVRERLPRADLFHYAGHSVYAGPGGWHSALPLAGSSLGLGDILTLARSPRRVVLLGCETARSDLVAPAEAAGGIGQAFLAAGSERVLAATRPVSDAVAATVAGLFYRAWLESGDDAAALRTAQLALRRDRPDADWASFRLLER